VSHNNRVNKRGNRTEKNPQDTHPYFRRRQQEKKETAVNAAEGKGSLPKKLALDSCKQKGQLEKKKKGHFGDESANVFSLAW